MADVAMKLAVITILVAVFVGTTTAATYTVGDKSGWTIPPSASFYTNWVAKQTFKVGDVLVFNFPAGAHTVAEVSKTDYDSCNTNNVSAVKSTAPASYTLSSGGTHYFICTITGHCSAGQKISIPVSANASSSPPASAPAPAPTPAKKTPSPAPATSPASTPTLAPSPAMSPSGGATSPAPSPAMSPSGGATSPAPSPSKSTGGAPTPALAPGTGTTTPPPSPVGPSPPAGTVPSPVAGPSGEPAVGSTPPPSAAPAIGGFGLLSLLSMVALVLF